MEEKYEKMLIITLMLMTVCGFAVYNVGDTVNSTDNISWTITGPAGHPDVGLSDELFNMIGSRLKPVMMFCGQYW